MRQVMKKLPRAVGRWRARTKQQPQFWGVNGSIITLASPLLPSPPISSPLGCDTPRLAAPVKAFILVTAHGPASLVAPLIRLRAQPQVASVPPSAREPAESETQSETQSETDSETRDSPRSKPRSKPPSQRAAPRCFQAEVKREPRRWRSRSPAALTLVRNQGSNAANGRGRLKTLIRTPVG